MRIRIIGAAVVVTAMVAWMATSGRAADNPAELKKIMEQKLEYAQAILEGIAVSDMKKVANNSASMIALTQRAEWNAFEREDYLTMSLEFRRAVEQMQNAAAKLNQDGAALGYVSMTMGCVNCHKVVRNIRKT